MRTHVIKRSLRRLSSSDGGKSATPCSSGSRLDQSFRSAAEGRVISTTPGVSSTLPLGRARAAYSAAFAAPDRLAIDHRSNIWNQILQQPLAFRIRAAAGCDRFLVASVAGTTPRLIVFPPIASRALFPQIFLAPLRYSPWACRSDRTINATHKERSVVCWPNRDFAVLRGLRAERFDRAGCRRRPAVGPHRRRKEACNNP